MFMGNDDGIDGCAECLMRCKSRARSHARPLHHPPTLADAPPDEDHLARAELEAQLKDLCERETKLMAELASMVVAEE